MRYSLRTLVVVMLLGGPLLASVWLWFLAHRDALTDLPYLLEEPVFVVALGGAGFGSAIMAWAVMSGCLECMRHRAQLRAISARMESRSKVTDEPPRAGG